jgi:histone deacetylase complex regulatory component SIN3
MDRPGRVPELPVLEDPSALRAAQGLTQLVDAVTYVRAVKTRFKDNKKVYESFCEAMQQFKAKR